MAHHASGQQLSRRSVLKATAVLAATTLVTGKSLRAGAARAQTSTPTRISLSQFVQDPQKLDSLRAGVAEMRSRRPSDPTSWFFQAAVHGVTDDAVAQAQSMDPDVASVDAARFWNQCPHFGQNSANFLLWHRAYLYYFERILRDAAGDLALSLPYWDYVVPAGRRFPRAFAGEFLDQAQTQPNPLFHPERELAFAFGLFELSSLAVDIAAAFNEGRFFGPTETEGFAGGVVHDDDDGGTQGLIERMPHNMIHFAVGGVVGSAAGAMTSVPTAAFDPIFWVHHSMIDRLWVEWSCLPDRSWGALPDKSWFNEAPWSFFDVDGTVKDEQRRHFIDHRQLGYLYDIEEPDCEPMALPDPLLTATAANADEQAEPAAARAETGTVRGEIRDAFVVADEPFVRLLQEDFALTAAMPELTAGEKEYFVEIADLEIEGVPLRGYDVYIVDRPDVSLDRSSVGYLGTLALFGLGHRHGDRDMASTQRLPASAALAAIESADQAAVVIDPFDLLVPSPSPEAALSPDIQRTSESGAISFSAIRILER